MAITNDTRTAVTTKPTTSQATVDASFWTGAVPGDVRSAAGIPNGATGTFGDSAVAFTMSQGARKDTLVWDKQSDALYVKQGKQFVKASDETRAAFMSRIDDPELRAVRRGSTYDGLRKDVLEAQKGPRPESLKNTKKEPELPKTDAKTDAKTDIYADLKKEDVKPQVDVKKPETVKPTEVKPQVEVKKPEVVKPAELSRADFVKEMSDKGISAKAPVRGLQVSKADLNADGVIRGENEANALFDELNRVEKAKTGPGTVTLGEKRVQTAVDDLRAAPGNQTAKPTYSAQQLSGMSAAMKGTLETGVGPVKPGQKDYLGRALSKDAVQTSMFAGWGGANCDVVHDPKLGFMKRQGDGPLVPMTQQEVKDFTKAFKNLGRPSPYDSADHDRAKLWDRMFPSDKVNVSYDGDM